MIHDGCRNQLWLNTSFEANCWTLFQKVLTVVEVADQILKELANDHPSEDIVKKSTTSFATLLESIERELSQHINHLVSVSKEQQQEQVTYTQEKVMSSKWKAIHLYFSSRCIFILKCLYEPICNNALVQVTIIIYTKLVNTPQWIDDALWYQGQ